MSTAESAVVDTGKATFSAAVSGLSVANAGTDFFTITGATGIVTKVLRIEVSGIATAAAAIPFTVVKRTTANSAGTATNPSGVPHDNTQSMSTAKSVVAAYTANPTLGATTNGGGTIAAKRGTVLTAAAGTPASPTVFDFTGSGGKYPTLRSATDVIALNLGGGTYAGNAIDVQITWTEEAP